MTWKLERIGEGIRTRGLAALGLCELSTLVAGETEESATKLLQSLAGEQVERGRPFDADEVIEYGYWLLKLRPGATGTLEIWELAADGKAFEAGCSLALRYWADQRQVCEENRVPFSPPRPDQTIAVSAGVLDDPTLLVEGVRYPAPSHASGWFLTTDRYSGDSTEMWNEHLVHVTERRPEIARYLALPPGSRFEFGDGYGSVYPDEGEMDPAS